VGGAAGPGWVAGRYYHLVAWATGRAATPAATPSPPPAPAPGYVPRTPPAAPGGFVDGFDAFDATRWRRSANWANGAIFDAGWRADHAVVQGGRLTLRLTDTPTAGKPYAAGEIATQAAIRYGRVEARMQPAKGDGVVSSLFTYTGPSEGRPHHEIDIEFLGDDTTKVQLGYFTDGKHYAVETIDLGFDAAAAPHDYAFEWGPRGITWFVDGKVVKREDGSKGPLPSQPSRVFANVWPTKGADGWAGRFVYPGHPIEARYDAIAVTPGGPA
jgi:beta-glucanase (GH16 family)